MAWAWSYFDVLLLSEFPGPIAGAGTSNLEAFYGMHLRLIIFACGLAFGLLGCERRGQEAQPQNGPIVGRWQYEGRDLSQDGYVRSFVIGDHTWWIRPSTEFFSNGTVNSGDNQSCNYWVLNASELKLDCSQGQTTIKYQVQADRLILILSGSNTWLSGGPPEIVFKKVS